MAPYSSDDAFDDESSSGDDDVSVSPVHIVPLLLPQPVPPFPANDVSIHSAGSTTDANASSDDDNTATLAPAENLAPINDALADVLLDLIAPDADILVANADAAARDILVPDAVAPDPPDDVSLDNIADASPDVTNEAPDPVAFEVLADDDAVEVTIDHNVEPTNTYNLRSRSAPTFGS